MNAFSPRCHGEGMATMPEEDRIFYNCRICGAWGSETYAECYERSEREFAERKACGLLIEPCRGFAVAKKEGKA